MGRGGPRGFRIEACLVAALAFAGSVLLAGAEVEKGRPFKSSLFTGALAFVGFSTSGLLVRGELALILRVALFAAVMGALAFAGFWLTKPFARWLRVALKHD
jgi:hypothetical protein